MDGRSPQSSSDYSAYAEQPDPKTLDSASYIDPSTVSRPPRMRGSLEFDGYIGEGYGGNNDDDYDLSGELISIEETYKEMALYRKSGASNDQLTNSLGNSDSQARRREDIQVIQKTPNRTESMEQSAGTSELQKRSMTVIMEEDLEESNMNYTQNLGTSAISRLNGKLAKAKQSVSFNRSQQLKDGTESSFTKDLTRSGGKTDTVHKTPTRGSSKKEASKDYGSFQQAKSKKSPSKSPLKPNESVASLNKSRSKSGKRANDTELQQQTSFTIQAMLDKYQAKYEAQLKAKKQQE